MSRTWIQRDGTPIAITDMTISHLANAIAMLERNFDKAKESARLWPGVQIEDVFPSIDDLRDELAKRTEPKSVRCRECVNCKSMDGECLGPLEPIYRPLELD